MLNQATEAKVLGRGHEVAQWNAAVVPTPEHAVGQAEVPPKSAGGNSTCVEDVIALYDQTSSLQTTSTSLAASRFRGVYRKM